MNEENSQPDIDRQKKTNRNLAIGVGVLGFSLFVLFYILLFAVMIIRPGLMFKIMPIPPTIDAALSDGNKAYLVVRKVDMSNVNPLEKRPPETRHYLADLDSKEPDAPQEIPAFAQAFGASGRLAGVPQQRRFSVL